MGRALPPLNALRAFEAASQAASFTAAAADLCVSQGAVSRHIARLEQHLGITLFERQNRQVRLTEMGAMLAAELHEVFDRIEEASRNVRRAVQKQRIRLGIFPTMANGWLMRRLSDFQELHPEVELQITCKTSFVSSDRRSFEIVSRRSLDVDGSMEYHPLQNIVLRPVCSPLLLAGPCALRKPEDLRHCTTLHSINRRDDWDAWLGHAAVESLDTSRMLFFENSVLAQQAAAAGIGVAMAICCGNVAMAPGHLVEPFAISLQTGESYGLSWPKILNRLPAIRAFRNWLRDELASQTSLAAGTVPMPPLPASAALEKVIDRVT